MPKWSEAITPIQPYGSLVSSSLCSNTAPGFQPCTPTKRIRMVMNAAAVITKFTVRVANTPR